MREGLSTRDFRETVGNLAKRDRAFRVALLTEALDGLLAGDVTTGNAILRDYVNASGQGGVIRRFPDSGRLER